MSNKNALMKLTQAERWLAEAETLDEFKQIHDIARAVEAYAQAHKLGLESENHARKIKFTAAREMGRLCPPIPPEIKGKRAHRKELSESRTTPFPERQRLSEFRKLAEIPEEDFRERLEDLKTKEEKITYNKILSKEKPHVSHASGENEWYTPSDYIEAARLLMSSIDVDPASNEQAQKIINANVYYTEEINGLDKQWAGNVWMNPPYSQPLIKDFCNTLVEKFKAGEINQACVLVNNATETGFFQKMLKICTGICFIRGRVKFIDKNGEATGTPLQGQVIIYFGEKKERFKNTFSKFGEILWNEEQ